jgi:hypothetical protein
LRGQSALNCYSTANRIDGRLESNEEAISFVLHDVPPVLGACIYDYLVVKLQYRPKSIAVLLEHPGRALDVREKETNGSQREVSVGHGGTKVTKGDRSISRHRGNGWAVSTSSGGGDPK